MKKLIMAAAMVVCMTGGARADWFFPHIEFFHFMEVPPPEPVIVPMPERTHPVVHHVKHRVIHVDHVVRVAATATARTYAQVQPHHTVHPRTTDKEPTWTGTKAAPAGDGLVPALPRAGAQGTGIKV